MNRLDKYFELLKKDNTKTLIDETSEANAKMYIKAKDDIYVVSVDHNLIPEEPNQKKCDFLIDGISTGNTHLIELKGANIEKAFTQLSKTIDYLNQHEEKRVAGLVNNRERMDAYIASPERQRVPDIHSPSEKELAKKLANRSKNKPKDMYQLIKFVKVVPKHNRLTENGRNIISSGRAPVELG